MTRNNADFQGGLFHGTTANLKPGDTILPANKLRPENHLRDYSSMPEGTEDHGSKAHATTSLLSAKVFGEFATHKTGLPHHIYEVEPHTAMHESGTRYSSASGFKIIRKLNPEEHPNTSARA
jgi:hypothetical protein